MNEVTKRGFRGTFLISTSILFGIIGVTYAENPRWTKITGSWEAKFDGRFNKIAIDQKRGIIYAGNGIGAGIYKSTNDGKTWEPINNGLPMVPSTSNYFPIVDIDISETSTETIYLTMRYRGVFKSAHGSNWMKRNGKRGMGGFTKGTALPQGEHYVLAMDRNDDNLVFAGTCDGPYKSTDGGENWKSINLDFPINPLDGLRSDINEIIRSSGNLYAISNEVQGHGIHKSTDDGENWQTIGSPPILKELRDLAIRTLTALIGRTLEPFTLPITLYTCLAINSKSNILYVGTSKQGIYKFDENENNWLLANDGLPFDSKGYLPIKSIVLDPVKANTIYTGTWGCGVYKSDNGGGSWSPLNKGLEDSKVRSLALNSQQQIIYAATTEGIFKVNLAGDVRGYIKDSMTNQPISEALIKLYHENDNYTGKYAYSESPNGYFKIRNVPVANYYLTITKSGYSSTRDPKSGTFYVPTTQEEQGVPEEYLGLNRGDLYLTALPPEPVITSSLQILESPPFHVSDTITSVFTITNKGEAPITFDVLTVGGRGPEGETDVHDFDWDHGITLNANESYDYRGNLTLNKPGKYHFFPTYRTPDGNWNSSIPAEEGIIRTLDIEVAAPFAHEVEIKLKDKSTIKGEIQQEKIKIKTKYGEMDIAVEEFVSIIGEAIRLKDGTTLKGNFAEKALSVKTDYAKLKVQTKDIDSIIFAGEPEPPPEPEGPLPEYHGVYLVANGKLIQIKDRFWEVGDIKLKTLSGIDILDPNAYIIFYRDYPPTAYRKVALIELRYNDSSGTWELGSKEIELKTAPLKGKMVAYKLIPTVSLSPGAYSLLLIRSIGGLFPDLEMFDFTVNLEEYRQMVVVIHTAAMEPLLQKGDKISILRFFNQSRQIARGDVIAFKFPLNPEKTFVERVIGLPGDVIKIENKKVYISGKPLSEPYVIHKDKWNTGFPRDEYPPTTVPAGSLFVLGDNRDASDDSRYWGFVPKKDVIGKVVNLKLKQKLGREAEKKLKLGIVRGRAVDALSNDPVWKVRIVVDGKSTIKYMSKTYRLTEIKPGSYTLKATAPNYYDFTKDIEVQRGRNIVDIPMKGKEIPDLHGIMVFTQPKQKGIQLEIRFINSKGEAITKFPCLPLHLEGNLYMRLGSEKNYTRGKELFSGSIELLWDSEAFLAKNKGIIPWDKIGEHLATEKYGILDVVLHTPQRDFKDTVNDVNLYSHI